MFHMQMNSGPEIDGKKLSSYQGDNLETDCREQGGTVKIYSPELKDHWHTQGGKRSKCWLLIGWLREMFVATLLSSCQVLPDLIPNLQALSDSVRLQDRPLYYLQCALEENCLSSSAYEVRNNSKAWRNNMRRLLRFSTIVHNRGDADFRPYVAKGQWEWHACHMHYHSMEVFAHYDIMNDNGTRLAEGSKASFCLEDTTCDRGVPRKFQCVGFGDQGLSVNCSDNYLYDIDCQWIDITDIEPGTYTFLLEVNPSMLVAELDYDNNVARCDLWYSGYFAKFTNCRHESLLDYRR